MVQIIESNAPKKDFNALLNILGENIPKMIEGVQSKQRENEETRQFEEHFPQYKGLPQEYRKMAAEAEFKKQSKNQELQFENKNYGNIKKQFGETFADIWKASDPGAKTHLMNLATEATLRGQNVDEIFKKARIQKPEKEQYEEIEEEPEIKPKKIIFDSDKGLTPKERTKREEDRYARNLPIYQDLQKKSESLELETDALDTLDELSPKISALERWNINPSTGELFVPALASKEAQLFVKTINDFTTKAKDSYGARVSNFELDRFMKRLPTLANSEEGRTDIIQQMKIINEINKIKDNELKEVIEEHGGIRKIDYDEAERIAEKRAKSKITELKNEFKKLDHKLDKEQEKSIDDWKKSVPKGKVAVQKADGTQGMIDADKVADFIKISGNKVL